MTPAPPRYLLHKATPLRAALTVQQTDTDLHQLGQAFINHGIELQRLAHAGWTLDQRLTRPVGDVWLNHCSYEQALAELGPTTADLQRASQPHLS